MLAMLGAPACGDSGGDGTEHTPEQVDPTAWRQSWELDELVTYAEKLGIEVVEDDESSQQDKGAVVAALEQATDCGCFGAECGTGYCDHPCGECAGAGETCFSGNCEAPHTCPMTPISATAQSAVLRNDTETLKFRYEAEIAGEDLDRVRIFSNTKVTEPLGPGTYDLRKRDLNDCNPCVAAYQNCTETECAQAYVAQSGFVEIESISSDGSFKGSLKDIKFDAAYEDPKTGRFAILEQFGALCSAGFDFDTPVESIVVEPKDCDPEGNGKSIGSKLRDFTLENCLGDQVEFHAACGSKALWLVAAAGW